MPPTPRHCEKTSIWGILLGQTANPSPRTSGYLAVSPLSPTPALRYNPGMATTAPSSRRPLLPRMRLLGEVLYHQVDRDRVFMQAAALTYQTLFSLLPIFVLSLLMLSTISVGEGRNSLANSVKRMLFEQLNMDKLQVTDETGKQLSIESYADRFIGSAQDAVSKNANALVENANKSIDQLNASLGVLPMVMANASRDLAELEPVLKKSDTVMANTATTTGQLALVAQDTREMVDHLKDNILKPVKKTTAAAKAVAGWSATVLGKALSPW